MTFPKINRASWWSAPTKSGADIDPWDASMERYTRINLARAIAATLKCNDPKFIEYYPEFDGDCSESVGYGCLCVNCVAYRELINTAKSDENSIKDFFKVMKEKEAVRE